VELIAEREQALAQAALKIAARRSMWALFLSVVALVVPIILFVAWTVFQQQDREEVRFARPKPVVRSTPTPTPTPEPEPEKTPEPLPPTLGELPVPTPAQE
jgi:cytoskeletal protein RodZ